MLRFRELARFNDAHENGVWCLAALPSGGAASLPQLLSGGMDGGIRAWRLPPSVPERSGGAEAEGGNGDASAVAAGGDASLLPGGGAVAGGGGESAHVLGVVSLSAAVLPGEKLSVVASSSLDGYCKVWSVLQRDDADGGGVELREIARADGNIAEAWTLSLSGDARLLASGSHSFRVNLWSVQDSIGEAGGAGGPAALKRVSTLRADGVDHMATAVAMSRDGSRVVAGFSDGSVRLFDAEAGKVLHSPPPHALAVRAVRLGDGGDDELYSGADDRRVHMYDARSGTLIAPLVGHGGFVLDVDSSDDAVHLASASADAVVKVWDRRSRECVFTSAPSLHREAVWSVRFLEGGARLASASDDRSVAVVDCSAAQRSVEN